MRNFGWPCYEGTNIRQAQRRAGPEHLRGPVRRRQRGLRPVLGIRPRAARPPGRELRAGRERLAGGQHAVRPRVLPGRGRHVPAHVQERAVLRRPAAELHLGDCCPDPATGLPKKGSVIPFLGTDCPARLRYAGNGPRGHPEGDLLYVDQRNDVVQRISYLVANQAPTAVATATPVSGVTPLAVTFSGLGSTDPDAGDVLTYAWDLDGDNLLDDSTLAQPTFTYETPGHLHGHAPGDRHPRRDRSGHGDGHRDRQRPAHAAVRPDRGLSRRGGQLGHQLRHADEAAHGRQSPGGKPPALQRRRHRRHGAEREAAPQRPRRRYRRRPGSLHGRRRLDGDGREVVQPAHVRRHRAG